MNDITMRKLNPTKTIMDALPKIIEVFVKYYGEEERDNIEQKFRNLLIVGYCSPNSMKDILYVDEKRESDKLIDEFLNNVGIVQYDKEKLKEIIFANSGLGYGNLHNIYSYIKHKNGYENYKEGAVEFLANFYPNVNVDNIDSLIHQNAFVEIDKLVEQYEELIRKYESYLETNKGYHDYVERCEELRLLLKKKYVRKYFEEIKDNFTEEEYQEIIEKLRNEKYYYLSEKAKNFFGFELHTPALIDSFSEENEKIVNSEEASVWRKESIKNDRIEYFKKLGIDLGDNYDDYMNNPKVIPLIPSQEKVKEVIEKRENAYTELMNEYYTSLEEYKINRQRIEQLGLINKNDSYNANSYENNGTFIDTNIKKVGDEYVLYSILCMSMEIFNDEYFDHYLIHELNHVYEAQLLNVNENSYTTTSGWDVAEEKINDRIMENVELKVNDEKRNYELLNEIINEYLAQEISQLMHDEGVYIFNTPENAKVKGGTGYEEYGVLVKEFYNTFKEDIIESRKRGNISILFEKVGQENLEELNKLFDIFHENFGGLAIYNTLRNLENGNETDKTKLYKELIIKTNIILEKMKDYSQSKSI